MLVPEIEEQATFGGESTAGHKNMLDVSRDVFARAEETVPLFISQGPMSAMPVGSVPTTHHSSNSYRLVDFISFILAS